MASTLGGTTIRVSKEDVKKDAQLFQMPLPVSPSSDLIALDLFGAMRTIDISGTYTSSDGTISTFISWLDGLISGSQSSINYVSDTSGITYTVVVQNTSWGREEGEANSIKWTISLLECASIT